MKIKTSCLQFLVCCSALLLLSLPAWAQHQPHRESALQLKDFRHDLLYIGNYSKSLVDLPSQVASDTADALSNLRVALDQGKVDTRTGRFTSLILTEPLLPGTGYENHLTWSNFGAPQPQSYLEMQNTAWDAFVNYLQSNQSYLNIDVNELIHIGNVAVHSDGKLVQIHAKRQIQGIPVRDNYLTAVINHGNLILFGAHNWGDIELDVNPTVPEGDAVGIALDYMSPVGIEGFWGKSALELVPMSAEPDVEKVTYGQGLDYRLVWTVKPWASQEMGNYEAMIDAHSGELLAFRDTNHYFGGGERIQVQGGVYPRSNDGAVPDGVSTTYPMPHADITNNGNTVFTSTGGVLPLCLDGNITTTLTGLFVNMNDNCGPVNETGPAGLLDLGTSGGTNCTTPVGASAGNTHATRTGFYELNKIIEMARSQLPNNNWLQGQLTANMNINFNCNATWNGFAVNFYVEGGGCGNTGEIAAVFDHEWGHGMDDNDNTGVVESTGEGVADIYAALRLDTPCIGRGFQGGNCGGYGNPCIDCSGVRTIDWATRVNNTPQTLQGAAACPPPFGATGPCGRAGHCEGATISETFWDMWKRDFPTIYGMDDNTAHELVSRLTFLGLGNMGGAYSCSGVTGIGDGCDAPSYYNQTLAADDDDGNLNNGTPHMVGIASAFDRHTIGCNTLTIQDSGCVGAPTVAPVLSAVASDQTVDLAWNAIAGATSYTVFRGEGVLGCGFGKTKLTTTTELSFIDTGLMNGHDYQYIVIPNSSEFCMGPSSNCLDVSPTSGPNLSFGGSFTIQELTGDIDGFVDNCENIQLSFNIFNIGDGAQNNVRIMSATSPSHGDVDFTSAFPVAVSNNLQACGEVNGVIEFTPEGLSFNDTLSIEVEFTSDELSPATKKATLNILATESDNQFFANLTYNFEAGAQGWETLQGTFNPSSANPGANGTSTYMASSSFLDNQCDQVSSPAFQLTATSTLSLYTQFGIEGFAAGPNVWYDRANIGIVNVGTGDRTPVDPDGGRLYNASGANGNCDTTNQNGYADTMNTWAESTWSATALGSAGFAGQVVRLDVRHGTDAGANGFGFWFDEITLTNVQVPVPDTQSDSCISCFLDLELWGINDLNQRQNVLFYIPHITNLGAWPPPDMVACPPEQ